MWFVIVLWHLILAGALFMAGLTISILRRRRRRQRLGLPVQFTPFDADGRRYDDIWLDDSGGDLVLGYRITNTTPAPFRPHPRFDGFTLIIGGVEVPHTRPDTNQVLPASESRDQRQYFMLPLWRRDVGLPFWRPLPPECTRDHWLLVDITTGRTLHPIIPTTIEPPEDTI